MQIIAGPGDFYWHEMFGIDGLMSPTHITLALGIMVVSIDAPVEDVCEVLLHVVQHNLQTLLP